jgi:MerR family transcriptional regulator, heat shock protein HspR
MNDTSCFKAKYRISALAKMLNMHPQTIRTYEKLGFIAPSRSKGNSRLFSDYDVLMIERIKNLTHDLGVNLAGVEVILRMRDRIEKMQDQANTIIETVQLLLPEADQNQKNQLQQILHECRKLLQITESSER